MNKKNYFAVNPFEIAALILGRDPCQTYEGEASEIIYLSLYRMHEIKEIPMKVIGEDTNIFPNSNYIFKSKDIKTWLQSCKYHDEHFWPEEKYKIDAPRLQAAIEVWRTMVANSANIDESQPKEAIRQWYG